MTPKTPHFECIDVSSPYGIGAVLSHRMEDGSEQSV